MKLRYDICELLVRRIIEEFENWFVQGGLRRHLDGCISRLRREAGIEVMVTKLHSEFFRRLINISTKFGIARP